MHNEELKIKLNKVNAFNELFRETLETVQQSNPSTSFDPTQTEPLNLSLTKELKETPAKNTKHNNSKKDMIARYFKSNNGEIKCPVV